MSVISVEVIISIEKYSLSNIPVFDFLIGIARTPGYDFQNILVIPIAIKVRKCVIF